MIRVYNRHVAEYGITMSRRGVWLDPGELDRERRAAGCGEKKRFGVLEELLDFDLG
jgi:Zn-finger nucleic acid-binding protein